MTSHHWKADSAGSVANCVSFSFLNRNETKTDCVCFVSVFLVRADNAWSPSTPPESVSCHVDLRLEKAENRWRTGKRSDAAQRTGTPTSRQQRSENPVKKTSINRNAPMQGIARVDADSPDYACRVGSPIVMVMD